jgi:hypothetical protein
VGVGVGVSREGAWKLDRVFHLCNTKLQRNSSSNNEALFTFLQESVLVCVKFIGHTENCACESWDAIVNVQQQPLSGVSSLV